LQSVLLLHGWVMQVPMAPFVALQNCPVGQLLVPPSPMSRQPVVHTPLLATAVSQ